jgi:hypothetical protein
VDQQNFTLAPLGTGSRHYLVITCDGSQTAAGVIAYIDGTVAGAFTPVHNSLTLTAASGLPVTLGARINGTVPLTGAMAFAEIYNCVLTPTQIATYYASGPGIY